jgi:hypothetical protein
MTPPWGAYKQGVGPNLTYNHRVCLKKGKIFLVINLKKCDIRAVI